jgi:hypothetical protein
MADKIGVDRKWLQAAGTKREHFDICLSKRALADKVKNLIVSNLTHEENQLWLANVDAFEERAYQRGRRAALLECRDEINKLIGKDSGNWNRAIVYAADVANKLAQEWS